MRLLELEPQFFRYDVKLDVWERAIGPHETWRERGAPTEMVIGPREFQTDVEGLDIAHAVRFMCPKCFAANGGSVGTHWIAVPFSGKGCPPGVCLDENKRSVEWRVSGTGYLDLTIAPSIWLKGGCGWHGFIENGGVRDA